MKIHNAEVLLSERLSDKIWARNYFEVRKKMRKKIKNGKKALE